MYLCTESSTREDQPEEADHDEDPKPTTAAKALSTENWPLGLQGAYIKSSALPPLLLLF